MARLGLRPLYAFQPKGQMSTRGSPFRYDSGAITRRTTHPLDRHFPRSDSDLDSPTDHLEHSDTASDSAGRCSSDGPWRERTVDHRVKAKSSILCLVVDDDCLIAGLEGGDIVVRATCPHVTALLALTTRQAWSLETFEQILAIHAHSESVLGLFLSRDVNLLFSSGADSIISVRLFAFRP